MPMAIIILFVITVLTAAAITVATQGSTSTTRDNNVKAEIEAAEAGLHMASYRLNQLKPSESQCIGESKLESEESKCKDSKESLGNGASFTYKTTKPLKLGGECAGRKVSSITSGTTLRCVTAEGLVNGTEPAVRLQAQVKAAAGEALFSVKGIVGLHKVLISGSVKVPAVVASNGEIQGTGSANFEQGFEICPPAGKFKPAAGEERKKSGVKIAGKNPEAVPALEKTRAESECPIKAPIPSGHPTAASNEDSRIGAADKLEGTKHTWNKEKFEFTMEGGSENKLTLGESGKTTRYFFCNFRLPGGSPKFKIAAGAKVEIFIGDPSEGTCAKGTGKFEIAGGAEAENEAKNPAALLIEMGGEGPFTYAGGTSAILEASIYAPKAKVTLSGNVGFKGGIVGYEDFLEGSSKSYEWSAETANLTNGSPSSYSRETWAQCLSSGSGC